MEILIWSFVFQVYKILLIRKNFLGNDDDDDYFIICPPGDSSTVSSHVKNELIYGYFVDQEAIRQWTF